MFWLIFWACYIVVGLIVYVFILRRLYLLNRCQDLTLMDYLGFYAASILFWPICFKILNYFYDQENWDKKIEKMKDDIIYKSSLWCFNIKIALFCIKTTEKLTKPKFILITFRNDFLFRCLKDQEILFIEIFKSARCNCEFSHPSEKVIGIYITPIFRTKVNPTQNSNICEIDDETLGATTRFEMRGILQ